MKFQVYGNHSYPDETLLYESNLYQHAERWAQNYTHRGLGGWECVDVVSYDAAGNCCLHWGIGAEEQEED